MNTIVKKVAKNLVLSACFLVGAAGCSDGAETVIYQSGEREFGTVRLPLTTTDSEGQSYRLSNATVEVTDVFTGIATPFDASAEEEFVLIPVAAGSFSIELLDGWVLEEFDGAAFVPVTASLVSPNPVALESVPGGSVELDLQFSTLNGSVGFGAPDTLAVSVSVNEAANLVDPSLCGVGQFCIAGTLLATGWPPPSLLNGRSVPFAVSFDMDPSAPPGGPPPPAVFHQLIVNSILFASSDPSLQPQDIQYLSEQSLIAPTTGALDVGGLAPHFLHFSAGPLHLDVQLEFLTDPGTGQPILSTSEGILETLDTCDGGAPLFGCVSFFGGGGNLTPTAARFIVQ